MIGYALALASYVILGLLFKSAVLNWVVGPVYMVVILYYLPNALRRAGLTGTGGRRT